MIPRIVWFLRYSRRRHRRYECRTTRGLVSVKGRRFSVNGHVWIPFHNHAGLMTRDGTHAHVADSRDWSAHDLTHRAAGRHPAAMTGCVSQTNDAPHPTAPSTSSLAVYSPCHGDVPTKEDRHCSRRVRETSPDPQRWA